MLSYLMHFGGSTTLGRKNISQKRHKTDIDIDKDKSSNPIMLQAQIFFSFKNCEKYFLTLIAHQKLEGTFNMTQFCGHVISEYQLNSLNQCSL